MEVLPLLASRLFSARGFRIGVDLVNMCHRLLSCCFPTAMERIRLIGSTHAATLTSMLTIEWRCCRCWHPDCSLREGSGLESIWSRSAIVYCHAAFQQRWN